ncbi:MAG: transposase [Microbacterium sp.]|uniref:transposase n=1 Tax=Microbacterium sp. TaxID=51671 RepID=UPI001AC0396C|nr:transposase [Microbacterium sp.]MBN9155110.1 transposase [Microbacterium sp.]MBN9173010.1 transposase [Microbacterium sp.]
MPSDELDRAAEELYALPPAAFTAARNAAAAAHPALAKAVKALRKPTVAAWAVNLLAAHGELGEAITLSAALHEAQEELDGAELARLGKQRRALVAALARQAVDLAQQQGVAVSAAARDEVEKTINAAVVDAAAGAAVLSGRLVRPLQASGVDGVDLTDAVGGSVPEAPEEKQTDELAERRAQREAERAAREAQRAADVSASELERIETALAKARDRARQLGERIQALRAELARVVEEAATAESEAESLGAQRQDAAARARTAAKAAQAARARLD